MKIEISDRVLRWFNSINEVFEKASLDDEISYHEFVHGKKPNKITIIRMYEDNDSFNPTKNHMILTL